MIERARILNILKKTMKEIRDYPIAEWKKVEIFDVLISGVNFSLSSLVKLGQKEFGAIPMVEFSSHHYSNSGKTINEKGYNSLLAQLDLIDEVIKKLELNMDSSVNSDDNSQLNDRKVFVVHGRDEISLIQLENMLRRIGLEPIVLKRMTNQGATIIEKFEKHADVRYAVVLLTPDDVGSLTGDTLDLKFRARQNVLFELGYFYAKLGRKNVACLIRSNVEKPSDIDGIAYYSYNSNVEELEYQLIRELRDSGLQVII